VADAPILTAPEQANLIAAQAVAAATSFLDGRSDACSLAGAAGHLSAALDQVQPDPRASEILDVTRLLVRTMILTAVATRPARAGRWADIMECFVNLLRHESKQLAETGAQRA
jgi:hypothetical protein